MISRILVALLTIPGLILVMLKGDISLWFVMTGIIVISTFEFYKMLDKKGIKTYKVYGILASFFIPTFCYFKYEFFSFIKNEPYFILTFFVMLTIITHIFSGKIEETSMKLSYTFLGILYVPFLFSHVLLLKHVDYGNHWILTAFLLVWASDSAAYFIGIKFGKHKMSPKISPKKSIEGGIAGIVAPILALFLIKYVLYFKEVNIPFIHLILLGMAIGIIGQLGDLGESLLKREYNIKDSGNLLFGHGGFLDRFDSLIFITPTLYYYVKFFITK